MWYIIDKLKSENKEGNAMERKRVWYAKYIGYCFTDNGKEVILEDVFYWEDENGKNQRTGQAGLFC